MNDQSGNHAGLTDVLDVLNRSKFHLEDVPTVLDVSSILYVLFSAIHATTIFSSPGGHIEQSWVRTMQVFGYNCHVDNFIPFTKTILSVRIGRLVAWCLSVAWYHHPTFSLIYIYMCSSILQGRSCLVCRASVHAILNHYSKSSTVNLDIVLNNLCDLLTSASTNECRGNVAVYLVGIGIVDIEKFRSFFRSYLSVSDK